MMPNRTGVAAESWPPPARRRRCRVDVQPIGRERPDRRIGGNRSAIELRQPGEHARRVQRCNGDDVEPPVVGPGIRRNVHAIAAKRPLATNATQSRSVERASGGADQEAGWPILRQAADRAAQVRDRDGVCSGSRDNTNASYPAPATLMNQHGGVPDAAANSMLPTSLRDAASRSQQRRNRARFAADAQAACPVVTGAERRERQRNLMGERSALHDAIDDLVGRTVATGDQNATTAGDDGITRDLDAP